MKIATWNVNSVVARLPLVLRWLEEAKPDVVCLQEIKCVDSRFPEEFADLGYESAVYGQPTYNGVAILSKLPIEDVSRGLPSDAEDAPARLITARIGGVRVVDVYVPNGAVVGSDKFEYKLDWLARLRTYLDADFATDDNVLLCGDFNVAPEDRDVHDPSKWIGQVLFSEPEKQALARVKDWGFEDAYRRHVEETGHYSWWDYRAMSFRRNAGLRIDHVWTSPKLAAKSVDAWIAKETRSWERPSDHAPVVVEFKGVR